MSDAPTSDRAAALDAFVADVLDPQTDALTLAVDVPMRAAMLGVPWSVLSRLIATRGIASDPEPGNGEPPRAG